MNTVNRTVCWYSCGAASAVATKIAVDEFGSSPLTIASIYLKREHEDNARFTKECAQWYGRTIHQLQDLKYDADPYVVFMRTRYLLGKDGAACTRILKREVRESYQKPGDRHVFGFTYDERDRFDRFLDANNHINSDAPLIRHHLTKRDCFGLLQKAGIELPMMYRLGYHNNNCIGCVKGAAGYWNKIRRDFPETFELMAQTEEALGPGRTTQVKITVNGKRRRATLRELPPNVGNYETEEHIECGAACQVAAFDYSDACDDL